LAPGEIYKKFLAGAIIIDLFSIYKVFFTPLDLSFLGSFSVFFDIACAELLKVIDEILQFIKPGLVTLLH
jgi:hypothetical protein